MNQNNQTLQKKRIAITASSISCAYGELPAALFGGVATNLSCRTAVPNLKLRTFDNQMEQPFWAPYESYSENFTSDLRTLLLLQNALQELPQLQISEKTLILICLPEVQTQITAELIQETLCEIRSEFQTATILIENAENGVIPLLSSTLEKLSQGVYDKVIFGSADSHIDRYVLMGLVQDQRCCSDKNPDRMLPGEGAAFVVFKALESQQTGQVYLTGMAFETEENVGKAATKATGALARSIRSSLDQSGADINQLGSIITGYVPDKSGTLEWHQCQRELWKENGRLPEHTHELNPHLSIGHCGSASLPMALVLALARFQYKFDPIALAVVCEIGQEAQRGALCLQKYSENQMTKGAA